MVGGSTYPILQYFILDTILDRIINHLVIQWEIHYKYAFWAALRIEDTFIKKMSKNETYV